MNERDAIVKWLRGPAWSNMSLLKRLHGALRFLFWPEQVCGAVARNIANAIERGDHLKGAGDE